MSTTKMTSKGLGHFKKQAFSEEKRKGLLGDLRLKSNISPKDNWNVTTQHWLAWL